MNTSIIRYIVGYILKIEAALLLIPSVVAAIYREPEGLCYLSVSALCIFLWCTPLFPETEKSCFLFKRRLCCHILKLDCTQFFLVPFHFY
ncbi:MAG: hypothetical protein ACLTJ5_14340 [Clostridium sp.]